MLMEAYFPIVVDMLGAHLACLSVSAVIYRDAEEVADNGHGGESIVTAIVTGVFFTFVMAVCAVIREVLGNATLWGKPIAFFEDYKISALAGAFGAYLILAIVLAVLNKATGLYDEHHEEEEDN